jgi:hypothetical protein
MHIEYRRMRKYCVKETSKVTTDFSAMLLLTIDEPRTSKRSIIIIYFKANEEATADLRVHVFVCAEQRRDTFRNLVNPFIESRNAFKLMTIFSNISKVYSNMLYGALVLCLSLLMEFFSFPICYLSISTLGVSLSPQHGVSSGCGWKNGHLLFRVAANILIKQPRTNDREWSSSLGVGCRARNPSP